MDVTGRKHDATGRSTKVPANARFRKLNSPPSDETWTWITRSLLESFAWRAMSQHAMRVLSRILVEHSAHAGTMNGELPVTYDDFVAYGVRRNQISAAITELEALGLAGVVRRGRKAMGTFKGAPATYRIEWFPSKDGHQPSGRWRRFETIVEARGAAAAARALAASQKSLNVRGKERLLMLRERAPSHPIYR